MELPLLFRTPSHSSTSIATTSYRVGASFSKTSDFPVSRRRLSLRDYGVNRIQVRCSKTSTERRGTGGEGIEERERRRFTGSAMEVTTFDQSFLLVTFLLGRKSVLLLDSVMESGALADIFLRGTNLVEDTRGMASLAFAAVLTAALTGSLYYVASSPKRLIFLLVLQEYLFSSSNCRLIHGSVLYFQILLM